MSIIKLKPEDCRNPYYSRLSIVPKERIVNVNIDAPQLKVYPSDPLKCGMPCDDTSLVVLGNFYNADMWKVVCGTSDNFKGECITGHRAAELMEPHNGPPTYYAYEGRLCDGELPIAIIKLDDPS